MKNIFVMLLEYSDVLCLYFVKFVRDRIFKSEMLLLQLKENKFKKNNFKMRNKMKNKFVIKVY